MKPTHDHGLPPPPATYSPDAGPIRSSQVVSPARPQPLQGAPRPAIHPLFKQQEQQESSSTFANVTKKPAPPKPVNSTPSLDRSRYASAAKSSSDIHNKNPAPSVSHAKVLKHTDSLTRYRPRIARIFIPNPARL